MCQAAALFLAHAGCLAQVRWLLGPGAQARQAVAECCSPGSCPHPAAEPEPWRQQLLSTAFAVGCSLLGGAAAVLIISRTQGL